MPLLRYTHPILVQPNDIDAMHHVNNVVYVRWVQETATAHWQAAAPAELQRTVAWVVLRHEIDYRRPAFLGEQLEARTWVGEATATTYERFVEIWRLADQTLLVQARSLWCPLHLKTGRPRRVDAALRAPFEGLTPPEHEA
ncbi:acyl-CoA thioester hydrolase [Catalinimonas alkaloidigena]|uniref:Acyl-CoA thioester hydrolase n=1 Tax=Catalinimonas alkaloidigena TaxID=1075417 RepID=A0A1G8ZQB2_9BACT|nr:acyl-CoA thioesterase [Catalinimonas alkaloidigena]SDK17258.1 acyl-CoA thioester hydrolase [Catalinimonas alkaloidigena]